MKKRQVFAGILTATLLITPFGEIINQNNIVEAAKNRTPIKSVVTYSNQELFKAFDEAYKKGELNITEAQYNEIRMKSYSRGYGGVNKTVYFWDGAKDEYMSGLVVDIFLTVGTVGIGTVIKYVPRLARIADSFSGGRYQFANVLLGKIISSNIDLSNGIIAYYRPAGQRFVQTPPAVSNYSGYGGYWTTAYTLSHIRGQ